MKIKRKILYILVWILIFSFIFTVISSSNILIKPTNPVCNNYSHNILGEFGTQGNCVPCAYAHQALKNIYRRGWHPFYYITLVCSKNKHASQRAINELGLIAYPTVFWDGDYRKNVGASSVRDAMETYNYSIIKCGDRNVKDIDIFLDVEWLGAVNPDPPNDETKVIIETNLSWTVTAMDIDVEVKNNEGSQYNGHLHVYVTEVESSYWNDNFDNPYTFAFLDYAWNKDVTLSSGGQWNDSEEWDGVDHHNGYGEYYDELDQDNCMLVAAVFDEDNKDYVDETAGIRAGDGNDPKSFDVFFGNTTPPPKVMSKTPINQYDPQGNLDFDQMYYWKVDVWDNKGNKIPGEEWSFKTRGNDPPEDPKHEEPPNNSKSIPIDTNLSWVCNDPDFDDVTYDVYFGTDIYNLELVSENQTERVYDPSPNDDNLEFNTKYFWQIVAWDEYGAKTIGDIWNFETEENCPPNKARDPYPKDGETAAPQELTVKWNGTDPNSGDKLTYDVYFDDVYPPKKQREWNLSVMEWEVPFVMPLYTTYYWRIDTWDKSGEKATGEIWSFTTGENNPPTDPFIDGPKRGVPETPYTFSFVSTDPEEHDVRYEVDWGDGNVEETDLFMSGEDVLLTHTWDPPSKIPTTIQIKAIAYDEHDAESGVSIFEFTLPRNRVYNFKLLEWLFERFPNAFPILKQLLGVI